MNGNVVAKKVPVVIVDDNAADALLAQVVINELQPKFVVQILTSGKDLVAYLQGVGDYSDRSKHPYPGLVLLDLKMPEMDGFAVLEWLKHHPDHAATPVVVLSGNINMATDVTRAYQLGAHSFLPKPIQLQDIRGVLSMLNISI